jgi:hypothetical protein
MASEEIAEMEKAQKQNNTWTCLTYPNVFN